MLKIDVFKLYTSFKYVYNIIYLNIYIYLISLTTFINRYIYLYVIKSIIIIM